jgi:hypothetical protein
MIKNIFWINIWKNMAKIRRKKFSYIKIIKNEKKMIKNIL